MSDPARIVMQRIDALAQVSAEPGRLTRTFCSQAMRRANDLVVSWMREAGMTTREDAIGNLIGHYPYQPEDSGKTPATLLLGSHLDTVRDAGKFDGALGVLVAIACVQRLREGGIRLPFAIEVAGFADEEGVRFQSAYLGSRALAGTFNAEDLKRTDAGGVTMAEAVRRFGGNPDALSLARIEPQKLLGYVEVHIEQGPVLEQKNLGLGVVTAIAGQTRAQVSFRGRAGHAGATPMSLRNDALCAAAEFILSVEAGAQQRGGLVATVGEIAALPGASNVIPGEARLSLDVRHPDDAVRQSACAALEQRARHIAVERGIELRWQTVQQTPAVICDSKLSARLREAAQRHQPDVPLLTSGAGHDAAAMAAITPVAMLFVRCKGGISHHPDESVATEDVRVAIAALSDFLHSL